MPKLRGYSVDEYFRLAEASPTKLEYKSGELIDMAGASYDHNRIAAYVLCELSNRLRGGRCGVTGSNTRVKVSDTRYCYPDVTVVCGEPVFDERDAGRTIANPQIIVEVLSPTTEAADRGEKFFQYTRVPSLREYVLVSQHQPRIESFVRQPDGSWSVGEVADGLEATLHFRSLDLTIPLTEIYANVRFELSKKAEPNSLDRAT